MDLPLSTKLVNPSTKMLATPALPEVTPTPPEILFEYQDVTAELPKATAKHPELFEYYQEVTQEPSEVFFRHPEDRGPFWEAGVFVDDPTNEAGPGAATRPGTKGGNETRPAEKAGGGTKDEAEGGTKDEAEGGTKDEAGAGTETAGPFWEAGVFVDDPTNEAGPGAGAATRPGTKGGNKTRPAGKAGGGAEIGAVRGGPTHPPRDLELSPRCLSPPSLTPPRVSPPSPRFPSQYRRPRAGYPQVVPPHKRICITSSQRTPSAHRDTARVSLNENHPLYIPSRRGDILHSLEWFATIWNLQLTAIHQVAFYAWSGPETVEILTELAQHCPNLRSITIGYTVWPECTSEQMQQILWFGVDYPSKEREERDGPAVRRLTPDLDEFARILQQGPDIMQHYSLNADEIPLHNKIMQPWAAKDGGIVLPSLQSFFSGRKTCPTFRLVNVPLIDSRWLPERSVVARSLRFLSPADKWADEASFAQPKPPTSEAVPNDGSAQAKPPRPQAISNHESARPKSRGRPVRQKSIGVSDRPIPVRHVPRDGNARQGPSRPVRDCRPIGEEASGRKRCRSEEASMRRPLARPKVRHRNLAARSRQKGVSCASPRDAIVTNGEGWDDWNAAPTKSDEVTRGNAADEPGPRISGLGVVAGLAALGN